MCTLFCSRTSAKTRGCRRACRQWCYLQQHWSYHGPWYEPCVQRMLQVLRLGELFNHNVLSFALRKRLRERQREMDGAADQEETGVCLHLRDNVWLSRPVSDLSGWPLLGSDNGKTEGGWAASLPIYHRPWPGKLWNFMDSFKSIGEPHSAAETWHTAVKKKKNPTKTMCCLVSVQWGQGSHTVVTQWSNIINGFLLLLSRRGNSWKGGWCDGHRWVSSEAGFENSSLPDNCYFDSERETYMVQEEESATDLTGSFPLVNCCF